MKLILRPASGEDLVRLFRAWRFWLSSSVIGALLGWMIYFISPPPYRSYATVNVDFNLEQAWPTETDRQQFYYLERETRKLEEIAWSDSVMEAVASTVNGVSVPQLRESILHLGQPGEGGWHFYADAAQPEFAAQLASTWANVFTVQAMKKIGAQAGIDSYIEMELTQIANLPVDRSISSSVYMLAGAFVTSVVCSLVILYLPPKQTRSQAKRSGKRTKTRGN